MRQIIHIILALHDRIGKDPVAADPGNAVRIELFQFLKIRTEFLIRRRRILRDICFDGLVNILCFAVAMKDGKDFITGKQQSAQRDCKQDPKQDRFPFCFRFVCFRKGPPSRQPLVQQNERITSVFFIQWKLFTGFISPVNSQS